MKPKFLPFILFFSVFLQTHLTRAASPSGGEITYRYIGNNQYLVQIGVYRDCRGIPYGSNYVTVRWLAGSGNNTSCGTGTLSGFTRVAINNVSNYCSKNGNPCNPSNTYNTGEGLELHIWQDTIDLSQSPFSTVLANTSCTELYIGAQVCCRNGAITTGPAGQDFHMYTVIYPRNIAKCNNQINNSPVFSRNYPQFVCCNLPQYLATGAMDTLDADSLSYALVPAKANYPNTSVTYTSPFTYQYPMTVKCASPSKIDCTPTPNANPPYGFYLNARTGDLVFTPTDCDEMGVVVVEITEWRRDVNGVMQQIAKTVRDVNFIVKDDCGYNSPPLITGNFSSKVIAGEKICLQFQIEDKIFSPYQTDRDTILVNWKGDNENAQWTLTKDTNPSKAKLDFCLQTQKGDQSPDTRKFTIQVSDDHCPKPSLATRTFEILIQERDSVFATATTGEPCAGVKLQATLKTGKPSQATWLWEIYDTLSGMKRFTALSQTSSIRYMPRGTYRAILTVNHQVYGYSPVSVVFTITDTIPAIRLGRDTTTCRYSYSEIVSTLSAMKAPVSYRWFANGKEDSSITGKNWYLRVDSNIRVHVIATDALGCVARDTTMRSALELPQLRWKSKPLPGICGNAAHPEIQFWLTGKDSAGLSSGKLIINGAGGKYGPNGLVDSLGNNRYVLNLSRIPVQDLSGGKDYEETLTMFFTDSNGCTTADVAKIRITGYPVIELTDKAVCQNTGELDLDEMVIRPKTTFGTIQTWSVVSTPNGVNPSGVLQDRSGGSGTDWWAKFGTPVQNEKSGTYYLRYHLKHQVTGCESADTAKLEVLSEPELTSVGYKVCAGKDSIDLLNIFLADNARPLSAQSSFKIVSVNGDTNATAWGNAKIQNHYLTGISGPGLWNIRCENSKNNCPEFKNILFEIHPVPLVKFTTSPDSAAPKNTPYFTTTNQSSIQGNSSLNFTWYFNYPDSTNTSTALAPQITYGNVDSVYTLRLVAVSEKGCSGFFEKTLKVGNPKVSVKEINAENFRINSRFQISGVEFQSLEICVYDAAGRLVACRKDNLGLDLIPGTYFYRIVVQNAGIVFHQNGKLMVK